jgi:hypothetical protein
MQAHGCILCPGRQLPTAGLPDHTPEVPGARDARREVSLAQAFWFELRLSAIVIPRNEQRGKWRKTEIQLELCRLLEIVNSS